MTVWLLCQLILSQTVLHCDDSLMIVVVGELYVSFAAGQRQRPCSDASARRRPVSKEASGVLLGLTLPLLVAALHQLHQEKAANLADPSNLQGQHLADPQSQHPAVHPSQRLVDLTSLEALQPTIRQGKVLEVLVNPSLAALVLAKRSLQPSVKQEAVQEFLVNLSLAIPLLAKTKAAPLAEDLDQAVEQVRRHLGSLLVVAEAERKGLGHTRALSRYLQP